MDLLMKLVLKFAFTKVSHLEHEHSFKDFGTAETADDWAQDVTIKVWQGLTGTGAKQFEGTGEQFYSWVHKIAFNQATDAFNDLLEEKKTKVTMFHEIEEEGERGSIETFTEENPLIHAEGAGYGAGIGIPKSATGKDREICILLLTEVQDQKKNGDYFMRGRTYAEVAHVLGMTENAVTLRFNRMRERDKAENEQKMEQARQQLEAQQNDTLKARHERFKNGGKR